MTVGPSIELFLLELINVLGEMNLTSLMLIEEQEASLERLVHCIPYN